jgi:hypothetical protein
MPGLWCAICSFGSWSTSSRSVDGFSGSSLLWVEIPRVTVTLHCHPLQPATTIQNFYSFYFDHLWFDSINKSSFSIMTTVWLIVEKKDYYIFKKKLGSKFHNLYASLVCLSIWLWGPNDYCYCNKALDKRVFHIQFCTGTFFFAG